MWTEINFALGKNGDHKPSGLDGRSIFAGRQAGGRAGRKAGRQADRQAGRQAAIANCG